MVVCSRGVDGEERERERERVEGKGGRVVGKRPISFSTKDGPEGRGSVPNTIVLVNGVHYK